MTKNKKTQRNYLENVPVRSALLAFETDEKGIVTLSIENKGFFNRVAQKLFKRPKISYVHLDEFGSFVWQNIDGVSDITAIGITVKEHFGEKAEPLYDRLSKFFQILHSYRFISFKGEK